MIAALNSNTARGRYANLCIRNPRRSVNIANRDKMAVTIHPPESGPVGRLGRGAVPPRAAVVSVKTDVVKALIGPVNVGGLNAPVALGGNPEAENVTVLGKPPVPGVNWIVAVMGCPAAVGGGAACRVKEKLIPVPDSEAVCVVPVVPPASSVIVSVAARAPAAAGVNVTLIVQLADGATGVALAHVVPVVATAKSPGLAPLNAKGLVAAKCNGDPPGLVTVIVVGLLVVFTPWLPKAGTGLGVIVAAAGVTPVRVTVCVEPAVPLASSVKMRVAVRVPLAVGVKVTLHVQVPLV